jgi:hypothetical protein
MVGNLCPAVGADNLLPMHEGARVIAAYSLALWILPVVRLGL